MKSCKRKLEDGSIDLQKEIYPEADQSQYFIPNKKAKHHVPKTFSASNPSQRRKMTKVTQEKKKVINVDTSDGDSSEDEATNQNSAVPSEKERQKGCFQRYINFRVRLNLFSVFTLLWGIVYFFEKLLREFVKQFF